ncbi:MAG: DegT/DnrJ/EryC1/StrS family aminotransferase [Gemmataceae bacterium]|nr:DegT/DnrJ/EryC1/StrS family aminotransferase [Gemmataceae bacterium]
MSAPTPVPLCDINLANRELRPQLDEALKRVLDSGQMINGPEVTALEKELADYCQANYALGCGSGTEALSLALHGLGIGSGDEVILPPYTFFATVGSVVRCGATPVFCDIDPVTFNIDPYQIESKITPKTKAIIAVHLFGQCADMDPIWAIAERHGLLVIEDAAQSLGAEYKGRKVGTLGAVACLSFYPSKNLGGFGDSGAVTTNDQGWFEKMRILRQHGMEPRYYHHMVGWNGRIDAMQAALLRVKLPHLDRWISERRDAAKRYDALIESNHLQNQLVRPVEVPGRLHTYNQYVVRVKNGKRDELLGYLKSKNIGCEVYYPLSLHQQPCFKDIGYSFGSFPASEEAQKCTLAFPMFPGISAQQQETVVHSCADFLRQAARSAA